MKDMWIKLKLLCASLIFCFISFGCLLEGSQRGSSYPYISGDTFRSYCDFIYDETEKSFLPSQVEKGNTIFLKTDFLEEFFKLIHPQIEQPYILITHNSDCPAPGNCGSFLDDEKLIAWFAQNVEDDSHPKLHPIPIGIANSVWAHGNTDIWNQVRPQSSHLEKKNLLYMNFSVSTKPDERSFVSNLFSKKSWCKVASPKPYAPYLYDLGKAKFVLSPRGNGLDCHRTWEALLMGAIPIVKTSTLDSLYEELPVIIVDDWKIITRKYLNQKYKELTLRILLCRPYRTR